MAEPDRVPHPACSHWSEHGAVISSTETKPNAELGSTPCPENPLLTPALLSCLIFSAELSRIDFNLVNQAENATSNILIPGTGKARQRKGAVACVLPWPGTRGGRPAMLPVAWLLPSGLRSVEGSASSTASPGTLAFFSP